MIMLLLAALLAPSASARDLLPADAAGPGCALDVRRAGTLVEAVQTGRANLENGAPITADTVFEIGSVSKQFIGAGLARLATAGRLRLDDPIRRWLPELPALYDGVTVAMLASHTSGIRNWNSLAELTGRGEDSTGYDNAWVLAAIARQHRLNNAPGAEYLYSNANFVLGAIIIERASGEPLNGFFRRAFFDRLGMRRTQWRTDFRAIVPGRAAAYGPDETGAWRLDMPLNEVVGAGGLLSTVGDLQLWAATLADPAPEDRAWVSLLLQPGTLADGTPLRYGMGIETDAVNGHPAFSHAGSTGSYRAWLGVFPAERLSVALLCNSGAVNTEDLGPEVAARYLPAAAVQRPSIAMTAPADLAGRYRNLATDTAVDAVVSPAGLRLGGGAAFGGERDRLATADGSRTLTITRDRAGRVTGLTVSRVGNAPVRLERVSPWSPEASALRAFVGAYRSVEVDGVQRIEPGPSGLVWRDPSGASHPLEPLYPNAFAAPDASWTLRFIPRPGGRMQLDMSITRARQIGFEREAAPHSPHRALPDRFNRKQRDAARAGKA